MNEMRKLMETVEKLYEYLVREGDPFNHLLYLNVFGDTGLGEDAVVYGPNDESWGEGELDPELQQEWMNTIKPYMKRASKLKREILKAAKTGRKLSHEEANAAENTWYDGSDSYSELELGLEFLPPVYENQLEVVEAILDGDIEHLEGGYMGFDEANQGGKTEHSGAKKGKGAYYGRKKEAKRDSNKNRRKADKAETRV
jgi:hypothetical protein